MIAFIHFSTSASVPQKPFNNPETRTRNDQPLPPTLPSKSSLHTDQQPAQPQKVGIAIGGSPLTSGSLINTFTLTSPGNTSPIGLPQHASVKTAAKLPGLALPSPGPAITQVAGPSGSFANSNRRFPFPRPWTVNRPVYPLYQNVAVVTVHRSQSV